MSRPEAEPLANGRDAPIVSVVIPCFNAARFVRQAVDSVLGQALHGVQLIVVNDGSADTEDLHRELAALADRIELIDKPHSGLAATRNAGLAAARGEFTAFLDADDVWKPHFLESQLDFLRASGADLVYADAELFGEVTRPGRRFMESYPSRGEVTAAALLLKHCVVVMSTVVGRTQAIRGVGGFDPAVAYCEDLDLWVRMLLAGSSIRYRRDVCAARRIHSSNMSNDGRSMIEWVLRIIDRYAEAARLTRAQAAGLDRRRRQLRGRCHESAALQEIAAGNAATAAHHLREAFREDGTARRLAGAILLSVLPSLSLDVVRERAARSGALGKKMADVADGPP